MENTKHQKNKERLVRLKIKIKQLKKEVGDIEVPPMERVAGYIKTAELPAVGSSIESPLLVKMPDKEKYEILANYKGSISEFSKGYIAPISHQLSVSGWVTELRLWHRMKETEEDAENKIEAEIKEAEDIMVEAEDYRKHFFRKKNDSNSKVEGKNNHY